MARLGDYWVFVSDTPFGPSDTPATLQSRAGTWSSHQTAYPNPSTMISANAQGRYVRVQLSGTNNLSLAEVQVFGTFTSPAAIAIFGTGVDSAGNLLADGAADPHYSLVASADSGFPGPYAYVVNSTAWPIPPWLTDGPRSNWIAPQRSQSSGNAPGNYTYRTQFSLSGLNPSTAILTGQFAADDGATILLNGVQVAITTSGFSAFTSFTISSGFVAGTNTLDFIVNNGGSSANPTGLRVDLSGTASIQ